MEDAIGNDLLAGILEEKRLPDIPVFSKDLSFTARKGFDFIINYKANFGGFPPRDLVAEECAIRFPIVFPALEATAERVRKRALSKAVSSNINLAVDALERGDPDSAFDILRDLKKESRQVKQAPLSFRMSGEQRYQDYLDRKTVGGFEGYASPWASLNTAMQGYVNGEFICIAAFYSGGKSWLTCVNANHLMDLGAKVLLVTMEMPAQRIARRLDALRYKIPFSIMRRADLGEEVEHAWVEKMRQERESSGGDIFIADKKLVTTVMDVADLATEHEADVVLVDGAYRFEGDGRNRWESTASTIESIQLLAEQTNIPWVATTQMGDANETQGKQKKTGSKPRAWGVRYGKEWLIEPDAVLIMMQSEAERELGVMNIHIEKVREGVPEGLQKPSFTINWDMVKMDFSEREDADGGVNDGMIDF